MHYTYTFSEFLINLIITIFFHLSSNCMHICSRIAVDATLGSKDKINIMFIKYFE